MTTKKYVKQENKKTRKCKAEIPRDFKNITAKVSIKAFKNNITHCTPFLELSHLTSVDFLE